MRLNDAEECILKHYMPQICGLTVYVSFNNNKKKVGHSNIHMLDFHDC